MAVASRPSRRRFIGSGVAAAVALALGLPERARSWTTNTPADRGSLEGFPGLDGAFLLDDASRDKFSFDTGRNIQRVPLAVLKPGSIDDVVRAVKHANLQRECAARLVDVESRQREADAAIAVLEESDLRVPH